MSSSFCFKFPSQTLQKKKTQISNLFAQIIILTAKLSAWFINPRSWFSYSTIDFYNDFSSHHGSNAKFQKAKLI